MCYCQLWSYTWIWIFLYIDFQTVNLVEVCIPQNCNVGLLAYSPLAGGVLSGKYCDPDSQAAKNGRLNLFPGYMNRYLKSLAFVSSHNIKSILLSCPLVIGKFLSWNIYTGGDKEDLAQRHGLTPAQLALAFVRDQPFVTSSIIGATTIEQLKEDLSAYTVERPLSAEIVSGINEIFNKYRDPTYN